MHIISLQNMKKFEITTDKVFEHIQNIEICESLK